MVQTWRKYAKATNAITSTYFCITWPIQEFQFIMENQKEKKELITYEKTETANCPTSLLDK